MGNDILTSVKSIVHFMRSLKFKGKKAAAFGCYGWSGESVAILKEDLSNAGFQVVDENIRSMWKPNDEDLASARSLVESLLK